MPGSLGFVAPREVERAAIAWTAAQLHPEDRLAFEGWPRTIRLVIDGIGECSSLLAPGVQLRQTRYDLASAAERIRHTAYPQAEDFARRSVLQPPSASEMLEVFAKAESMLQGAPRPRQ
jgi:hypothetical protein